MRVAPDLICDLPPLEATDMLFTPMPSIDCNSRVFLPTLPALPSLPSLPYNPNPFTSDVLYGMNSERQMEAYNHALETILKISQLQARFVEKASDTELPKRPRELKKKVGKVGKSRAIKRIRGKLVEPDET